jgi:hypothetical protein
VSRRAERDEADVDAGPVDRGIQRVRDSLADRRLLLRAWSDRSPPPQTLALFLGPYRNLTTLTAAVLGLHPECVVFNHGFVRVVRHRSLAPFAPVGSPGFDRFLRFAVAAATEGRQGSYGGTIEASHAHERSTMQQAQQRARALPAGAPRVVVWKDSMRITNHLRTIGQPPAKLAHRNPRVRFVLPIRNPLDCARSNAATRHGRYLAAGRHRSAEALIEPIVREIRIFQDAANLRPGSFFSFVEGDDARKTFAALAEHLGLDAHDAWLDLVELSWDVGSTYDRDAGLEARYRTAVAYHLEPYPELRDRLLAFAD